MLLKEVKLVLVPGAGDPEIATWVNLLEGFNGKGCIVTISLRGWVLQMPEFVEMIAPALVSPLVVWPLVTIPSYLP